VASGFLRLWHGFGTEVVVVGKAVVHGRFRAEADGTGDWGPKVLPSARFRPRCGASTCG
jgi:hypothetical protein